MIADMAVRLRLPAVYSYRFFVTSGGLASYSIDGRDSDPLWFDLEDRTGGGNAEVNYRCGFHTGRFR